MVNFPTHTNGIQKVGGEILNISGYSLLGITVHALEEHHLSEIVLDAVRRNQKIIFAHYNLHGIYLYHHKEKMRNLYQRANYVHIDGMPIIWIGKLFGYPLKRENRLTSLDFLPSLLSTCEKEELRVFLLGSEPGVAEKAAQIYLQQFPRLQIKTHHGYFDAQYGSEENNQVVRMINDFHPHLLLVGMGMPRQEIWLDENIDDLNVNVAFSLGAFMDYIAGVIPTPPRWMGRVGLEWLYRLFTSPKRVWKRYLIEPWFVLGLILKEWSRKKTEKAPVDGSVDK
jgi:N-acetylglucosaminyldiphosphoundecaprenol N-acetyl-beta-D-mannosaminyltransferase